MYAREKAHAREIESLQGPTSRPEDVKPTDRTRLHPAPEVDVAGGVMRVGA